MVAQWEICDLLTCDTWNEMNLAVGYAPRHLLVNQMRDGKNAPRSEMVFVQEDYLRRGGLASFTCQFYRLDQFFVVMGDRLLPASVKGFEMWDSRVSFVGEHLFGQIKPDLGVRNCGHLAVWRCLQGCLDLALG